MSNRLDRKASNVRINKRLADESPVASPLKKAGFVKYHNGNANLDDDPDKYFDQETDNDPLALIKTKTNPGFKGTIP